MSNNVLKNEFCIDSVYIIEALDMNGKVVSRGTCFSIQDGHVITAKHVLAEASYYRCYLTSDDFNKKNHHVLSFEYSNSEWDFSILKKINGKFKSFLKLGGVDIEIGVALKSCGYPVEKGYLPAPINVAVTNVYDDITTHNYSYEVSQSPVVKHYIGMSGSPVIYNGYAIGLLVVQQGASTLKVIAISDALEFTSLQYAEINPGYSRQEEIDYVVPEHPPTPFKTCIDCDVGIPNIKGIDIGFDYGVWRSDELISYSSDWIIDYSLTASQKVSLANRPKSQMNEAISQFDNKDINVMSDLFLHMAIRKSYKTIPIVNKVINTQDGDAFSCSHVVLDKGRLEIWLGASVVEKNLSAAVIKVVENIKKILTIPNIKNRLVLITSEMDDDWPFKERLKRISDNSIPLKDRFDRIVVPVFIAYDSGIINPYVEDEFLNLFQDEIDSCREIISGVFDSKIIKLIDLKVFVFPVDNGEMLHEKLLEEFS